MSRIISFLIAITYSVYIFAQAGCTDPQANNYDDNATINDGSCTYNPTEYVPPFRTTLADELEEISAMFRYNNRIFGLADSGNPNAIYELDTITGQVIQEYELIGTENEDWESMTFDGEYVYVGDTGNNKHGNRTNLVIYKFPASDLEQTEDIPSNHIERLYYSYEDQTDFTELPKNKTRYDCESIITMGDSLYLFSKDWKQFTTRYYTIPKGPGGHYSAILHDSLFVEGIVTDAAVLGDSVVVLLGTSLTGKGFLELLWDFPGHQILAGNKRQILLNQPQLGQPESIILTENLSGFIGTESFKIGGNEKKQALFSYSIHPWLQNQMVNIQNLLAQNKTLELFPNPVSGNSISIKLPKSITDTNIQYIWVDSRGSLVEQKQIHRLSDDTSVKCSIPVGISTDTGYLLMQMGGQWFVGVVVFSKH